MIERAVGEARFPGVRARGVTACVDVREHPQALGTGFWAVVADFEGRVRGWRFADVERTATGPQGAARGADDEPPAASGHWSGPAPGAWTSSMDRSDYLAAVGAVREAVRAGDVYQVNVCRVLAAPLATCPEPGTAGPGEGVPTAGGEPSARALHERLAAGNPAPYGGYLHVPAGGGVPPAWVVTASPELFLEVRDGWITSGPIKGTALDAAGLTDKDAAENVMIADMVRNDLQRVCRPGTVEVVDLLAVEHHPGLVHLVTRVRGRLLGDGRPDWSAVLGATFPPASVSGAPKHSALGLIERLEPVPRGPYCGAVGWVDGDAGTAVLAVGIRTFWWGSDGGGTLRFGTGAGITWGSDAGAEWAETELKAARLVGLASASR